MGKNILITGVSSGLGEALVRHYLAKGFCVYGTGRHKPQIEDANFHFHPCDLSKTGQIQATLTPFLEGIGTLDTVILNAGMLGEVVDAYEMPLNKFKEVFELNVWANKEIFDLLHTQNLAPYTLLAISSGAAKNGSKGWAAYSVSKAGLNMLVKSYAHYFPGTKMIALAPGVIKTPMVEYIINDVDEQNFPSATRLKEGYIQSPKEAAKHIYNFTLEADAFESGSFVDIRQL